MESLLLFGYSAIFAALVIYVLYIRRRLSAAEQRLDDLDSDSDTNSDT